MAIDSGLLAHAKEAAANVAELECQAEQAKAEFRRRVRHLHLAGASMREVAGALGISHQRVHQLVEDAGGGRRWRRRRSGPSGGLVACSFCGRGSREVATMVAGPCVYICDCCVSTALEVVTTNAAVQRPGAPMSPVDSEADHSCSFCSKHRRLVPALVTGLRASVCAECLELCQDIMDERLNR